MAPPKYSNLVLDLGGVLFDYSLSGDTPTPLPPRTIKHVLDSPCWYDYERGLILKEQCHEQISKTFGIDPPVWEQTLGQLEATLTPNQELAAAIKSLKAQNPGLRVHAFSNVSVVDYELLRPQVEEWGFFDTVVTSFEIGERKPDFNSYERMLQITQAEASASVMVDDRHENVITAQALGMHGILFDTTESVAKILYSLFGDPVARGMDFLRQNAKNLWSMSNKDVVIRENFSQLLILECTGERDLVTLKNDDSPLWNFFAGPPLFTDEGYPKDSDTTSLAHLTLDTSKEQREIAMETILKYQTRNGLPYTYFDHTRPRCCLHICAGVLRFFYLNGNGEKLAPLLHHLTQVIETRAYEIESRYYIQPEWILYHLADLCGRCSDHSLDKLRSILVMRLGERMGCDRDVLGAVMRVLSAQALGMKKASMERDIKFLIETQERDGGWPLAWMWRYGKVDVRQGSRGVPTAMAVKAFRVWRDTEISA